MGTCKEEHISVSTYLRVCTLLRNYLSVRNNPEDVHACAQPRTVRCCAARGVAFTVEALAFGEGFLGASRRGPQNAPAASAAGTADPAAAAAAVSVAAAAAAADEAASVCSRESKLTGKQTTTGPLSVHSYVGSGQVRLRCAEAVVGRYRIFT